LALLIAILAAFFVRLATLNPVAIGDDLDKLKMQMPEDRIVFDPHEALVGIDSRSRTRGDVTDFTIEAAAGRLDIMRYTLSSLKCYLQVPNVNRYNHNVAFTYSNPPAPPTTYTFTLLDGIYSVATLTQALVSAMNLALGSPPAPAIITGAYDSIRNAIALTCNVGTMQWTVPIAGACLFSGNDALCNIRILAYMPTIYLFGPHMYFTRYIVIRSSEFHLHTINPNHFLGRIIRDFVNILEIGDPTRPLDETLVTSSYSFKWDPKELISAVNIQLYDDQMRPLLVLNSTTDFLLLVFKSSRG